MNRPKIGFTLTIITILLFSASICQAGNKRLMSITAARVLAERALVETIHGLELKTTESIADTVTGLFESKVETRSSATISGIKYEEIVYDQQKDIAKVTASIELDSITNTDGETINLGRQKIRRIGFATSTRANAAPLRAMRAAELDAYKQLAKQVVGFTLESRTTVENYILKSDVVKAQVMATLYLARITDFFWDDYGDAHVKMALDLTTVSKILGEKIIHDGETVEVEGMGSPVDETKLAVRQTAPPTAVTTKPARTEIVSQAPVNIPVPQAAPIPSGPSSMPTELSDPADLINLPQARKTNKNGIAVIIGNRDYDTANKNVPNVDYAINDAEAMHQYVTRTLGYRQGNVILLKNATQADLTATFGTEANPRGKLFDWVKPGESDVFIYYSGHGAPSLADGKGYLLPVNSDPAKVELNGYGLDVLYANLAMLKANNLTVVIDACFSGSYSDGSIIKNASSIALKTVKAKTTNIPNAAILTAAESSEVASWDKEIGHGLFTSHFLAGVSGTADTKDYGNNDGQVSLAELRKYLEEEVTYKARRLYGREQHPQISGAGSRVLSVLSAHP